MVTCTEKINSYPKAPGHVASSLPASLNGTTPRTPPGGKDWGVMKLGAKCELASSISQSQAREKRDLTILVKYTVSLFFRLYNNNVGRAARFAGRGGP